MGLTLGHCVIRILFSNNRTGSGAEQQNTDMNFNILGLFAGLLLVSLLNIATCLPSPEPEPSPIIPSKLALLYTPFVCPFFYVGKAVKAVETAVNAVTGK